MASNQLYTIAMITNESARVLSNNIVLARLANRDYDSEFGVPGKKIGQTLSVRKPPRYKAVRDMVVNIQAETDTYTNITYTNPYQVAIDLDSAELLYSFDDFAGRIVKPAMVQLANLVDSDGLTVLANNTFMNVGTPGTAITTSSALTARQAVLAAKTALDRNAAPIDDLRHFITDSSFNNVLADSASTIFNPQSEIGSIWKSGKFGEFGGFSCYMDQQTPAFTVGTFTGTITTQTTGTVQTGSVINLAGFTAGGLNVGDTFTVAGVYGVNPQSYQTQSWLQPFTVTTAFTESGGVAAVSVTPAVVATGPFQNVSQAIPNSAAVTVLGASGTATQLALGFHRDAILFANSNLPLPTGGTEKAYDAVDPETKLGVRVTQQWDIRTSQHIIRFDCMAAWAPLYNQLAAKVYTI